MQNLVVFSYGAKILSERLKKHGAQLENVPLNIDLYYSRVLPGERPVLRENVGQALAVVLRLWTSAAHLASAWGTTK